MALAVELFVVNAVGKIDEQFTAGGALEAGRMPSHIFAEFGSHDTHRSSRNVSATTVASLKDAPTV